MAVKNCFEISGEISVNGGFVSQFFRVGLRQRDRLGDQTTTRSFRRSDHCHWLGVPFNDDFGPGANAVEERGEIVRRFCVGQMDDTFWRHTIIILPTGVVGTSAPTGDGANLWNFAGHPTSASTAWAARD